MSKKLVIGINGDFRPSRKEQVALSWLNTGYYDSVTASGGLPIMIPPYASDDDLKQALDMIDGLILGGCALDLDPVRLGMDRHPTTRTMPSRREDFDRRLCRMAVERRMPILAIGSGMQLLNVICGGTLFQQVTEDIPKALHHRDTIENTLRHIIEIVPGTRVDAIYGPGEIRVNSSHHQGVDQVASLFKVSAKSPDGVIEAFESVDDDWFCLGVQWHPESESASRLDMQVFENFLDGCRGDVPATIPMRKAS
ncbi:MAG: gamma-glutamyl-gamma-aminobutyrate hydrolase family protein [Planctomycetales bacterium]